MLREADFWAKVDKAGSCWWWRGAKSENGYGVVSNGIHGKRPRAHRMSWELTNGPIPPGLYVLHKCDNPPCVNPAHLFLGTQADNIRDMDSKGRRRTVVKSQWGEANASAKLTKLKVYAIRAYIAGGMKQREVAAAFGISRPAVSLIVNRKRWP